ncbi:PREDICTED: T-cell surface glycoprotein YE1/48-like [Chinchilla lanigera]|uniref:T-cell surface glycoprotein YE1/48-like n=1 Tax=Chinchilla lanigera TaxID=34839 RepID=UPI00038EBEB0|nr:PREDICTED: T-cell surface glycoprotein YE1/48-like [Chinchilla lanigera]
MSNEEVTYSTLRFLQSPSKAQSRLGPHATERPRKADDKGFAGPWHLIAAALGILCLLLLTAVVVLVIKIFQEKNEKEKIAEDLRQAHITQNNSSLKELLTNRTLEYDIVKNKLDQTIKQCHGKEKTAAKPLRVTGKTCEGYLTCYGVKCYYIIMDNKTWEKCKQTCQKHGLSLLKIDDKDELAFLRPLLGPNQCWIGLFFDPGENRWIWMGNGTSGM